MRTVFIQVTLAVAAASSQGPGPSQFVVTRCHNIWKLNESLFMVGSVRLEATVFTAEDYYCLLWPNHNNLKVTYPEESGHAMSNIDNYNINKKLIQRKIVVKSFIHN